MTWLRDRARGSTSARHWTRDGLVVGQAALALVLLFGSGLLLRSFAALKNVDPGYVAEDIFTFQMAPDQAQLSSAQAWASFHLAFMERLRALPGVETVGIVENFPLDEGYSTIGFTPEPTAGGGTPAEVQLNLTFTAGDYFEAMGVALLQGRVFTDDEQRVNQAHRHHEVDGRASVARRRPARQAIDAEPVRVAGDRHRRRRRHQTRPFRRGGRTQRLLPAGVAKARDLDHELAGLRAEDTAGRQHRAEVRALVREVAPEAPMYRTYTIEELVARSMAQLTFTMIALGLAAGLALVLGMVGLYSILSSSVAERTRELGVRIALGAQPQRVRRMVVMQGMRVVAVGLVVGVVVVLFGARALDSLLYGVRSLDAVTLLTTSLLMLLVGIAACWIPAYRASAVDPARTLAQG